MNMKAKESLIEMLIDKQVLKFGSFKLNSGRISPYFFNLGAIDDGMSFYDLGLAMLVKFMMRSLFVMCCLGQLTRGYQSQYLQRLA